MHRRVKQVQGNKLRNSKQEYKKIKDHNNKSGSDCKTHRGGVTSSAEVGACPCSGRCSAFEVTGLLAIIDPFFIFHWFCLVFPHTCFQSHSLPVVYLTLCFPSCLCQRLFIVSVVFFCIGARRVFVPIFVYINFSI